MSSDITRWLAEIRELKQQLADSIRDRQAADESAASWRKLYTTEAEQRRIQARLAQQQIEALQRKVQQLQGESDRIKSEDPEAMSAIEQEVAQLLTIEELKARLTEIMLERDRLIDALKAEQTNHVQTRKSLTAVIGDTIDQLSKQRGSHH